MKTEDDVDSLAQKLLQAKLKEDSARKDRLNCELALIDICGQKAEGSLTVNTGNYRVETKAKIDRKIDQKAFDELMGEVGDDVKAMVMTAVTLKPSLRLTEYRELADQFPEAREELDRVVTSRQAKTQVSVKAI
jgi:hypothetical protein